MLNIEELNPVYNNQKSFYGKALIKDTTKGMELYSYNTLVAKTEKRQIFVTHNDDYLTQTTLKHIKEFIQQVGYKKMSKKELLQTFEDFQ